MGYKAMAPAVVFDPVPAVPGGSGGGRGQVLSFVLPRSLDVAQKGQSLLTTRPGSNRGNVPRGECCRRTASSVVVVVVLVVIVAVVVISVVVAEYRGG